MSSTPLPIASMSSPRTNRVQQFAHVRLCQGSPGSPSWLDLLSGRRSPRGPTSVVDGSGVYTTRCDVNLALSTKHTRRHDDGMHGKVG
jgi:hypothetical protein